MRISLLDLPNEVLTNIFSYNWLTCTYVHNEDQTEISVWPRQRDLYALCLTSRRISEIAQRILLGDIQLKLCGKYDPLRHRPGFCSWAVAAVRDRASLLLRSCFGNSHLQHRLRRVEVCVDTNFWRCRDFANDSKARFFEMSTQLQCLLSVLSMSSSLISLKLDFTEMFHPEGLILHLDEYPDDCFGALKSLDIRTYNSYRMSADDLLRWCKLPQLEHLTVGVRILGKNSRPSTGPYMVKSLRVIDQCFYLAYGDFIQSVIPELGFLTVLDLPMLGCRYKRLDNQDIWDPGFTEEEGTFSPHKIGTYLTSTVHSLRHLSIVSVEHITFHAHDNSVLDLSEFVHLQKVRLSAYFFMCWRKSRNTSGVLYCLSDDLVELLPAALEEFEIVLDGEHGLFYGFDQLKPTIPQAIRREEGQETAEQLFEVMWWAQMKSHDFVLRHLRWITDLLAAQPVRLPGLTKFLVSEGMSPGPFMYSDLTEQFPLLIQDSGVDVRILQKVAGQCRASDLPRFDSVADDVVSKLE